MPAAGCQPASATPGEIGGGAKPAGMAIIGSMITILSILVALSMAATLGVLFAGMLGVVRGSADPMRSNRLMRWRVMLQGLTIVLRVLLLSLAKS